MWSMRLRELIRIRNQARVLLEPPKGDTVTIGRTVTVKDELIGETRITKIGSYMVLTKEEDEKVSYNTPLARMLVGGRVGNMKESVIAGRQRRFRILKIEWRSNAGMNSIIRSRFFFLTDEDWRSIFQQVR